MRPDCIVKSWHKTGLSRALFDEPPLYDVLYDIIVHNKEANAANGITDEKDLVDDPDAHVPEDFNEEEATAQFVVVGRPATATTEINYVLVGPVATRGAKRGRPKKQAEEAEDLRRLHMSKMTKTAFEVKMAEGATKSRLAKLLDCD